MPKTTTGPKNIKTKTFLSDMRSKLSWTERLLFPGIINQMESVMATLEQVQQAVALEAAQVQVLREEVIALREQVASGTVVTAEQLDALLVSINNIHTPDQPDQPE